MEGTFTVLSEAAPFTLRRKRPNLYRFDSWMIQEKLIVAQDAQGPWGLYPLYRRCSLAVLNSGGETDDARAIFERYADFDISIVRQAWGVKLISKSA